LLKSVAAGASFAAASSLLSHLAGFAEAQEKTESKRSGAGDVRAELPLVPYGAAVRSRPLTSDADYREAIIRYCDFIVPEHELKWRALRQARLEFDFAAADSIVEFAIANKKRVRGHTLLWDYRMPAWTKEIDSAARAAAELELHIRTVVDRYRGAISCWDVVNEPLRVTRDSREYLSPTIWMRHLGSDYIAMAFRIAHESDPGAKLYINEFDLEFVGSKFDARRNALISLVRRLKDSDVPIHGVGIQGHLWPDRAIDRRAFESFLKDLHGMKLDVMVSELDVIDERLPGDPDARDAMIAQIVYEFLDTVCSAVRPAAIFTWGLSDKYSWISEDRKRKDGLASRAHPLDAEMHEKKMWSVIDYFRRRAFPSP
jgi:endo-1,4-beta-xylanase